MEKLELEEGAKQGIRRASRRREGEGSELNSNDAETTSSRARFLNLIALSHTSHLSGTPSSVPATIVSANQLDW